MKRLWRAPGVMAGMSVLAASMIYTWHRMGLNSPHFWWSLLIVLVWAALVLTFRYWRERWRLSLIHI